MQTLLSSRPTANQETKREEGTDGNVLVVHQVLFRQWQRVDDGAGFLNGFHVKRNNHSPAVALKVPLADLAVEIKSHRCPDLVRHDVHDLLTGRSLFRSLDDQHLSSFG